MTKESFTALIEQHGKEKLIRMHFNNNLVENVYGTFDPDEDIVDIGGTDFVVFKHTVPATYDDPAKGVITVTQYKPIESVEGVVFIDDVTRIDDIDRWVHDRI